MSTAVDLRPGVIPPMEEIAQACAKGCQEHGWPHQESAHCPWGTRTYFGSQIAGHLDTSGAVYDTLCGIKRERNAVIAKLRKADKSMDEIRHLTLAWLMRQQTWRPLVSEFHEHASAKGIIDSPLTGEDVADTIAFIWRWCSLS